MATMRVTRSQSAAAAPAARAEACKGVLSALPHELLLHVASYADSGTLNDLLRSCRALRALKVRELQMHGSARAFML